MTEALAAPAVDGVEPGTSARPTTAEELAELLKKAAADRAAVVPVGGGRALGLGDPPERYDLALSTTGLDRLLELSQSDLTCTVEAGVPLERLQEELGKAGQFLPLDPRSAPGHTVGGALASGWTGPLRQRFGTPREFVIGLRVALPDGRLVRSGGRVVKNVSGYDLNKLHLGALGTLGVIVEASFKVFPRPLREVTVEHRAEDLRAGWAEAARVLRLPGGPWALELERDAAGEVRLVALVAGAAAAVARLVTEIGWEPSRETWPERSRVTSAAWARISARRAELPEVLGRLPERAHWIAQPGTGTADWLDARDPEAVAAVRAAAEAAGGALTMLAAPPGLKRQLGAWGTPPPTADLMRRLRDTFDPGRVINPGRFLV